MSEFRTRIGRIRMKNGGAEVRVLHTPILDGGDEPENWRGKMIENAKEIASYEGDLNGYVVIGLWADGCRSLAYRMSPHIPSELFPSYIAEMLRTDAVTDNAAAKEFDRRFEWVDQ